MTAVIFKSLNITDYSDGGKEYNVVFNQKVNASGYVIANLKLFTGATSEDLLIIGY